MRTARLWTGAAVGILISAAVVAAAAAPDPVALLVKFEGDVTVERQGAEPLAGAVGLALQAGDRLVVGDGSRATVLYRDGKLVRAAAPVTIEAVEAAASSGLFEKTVSTLGQVASTDARTQPNRQGMIRPIAGAPVPIAPRNEIKVLSPRPTFTWFSVPDADGYMIQLQRHGPDSPRPVRYSVGTDTAWTLPASAPPLVPGARYTWAVGGEGVGRVASPQHFVVASAEDLQSVESALGDLVEAGIDPDSDGLFLAALAYRDAGFVYEARRAIDRLEEDGDASGRAFFLLKGDVLDSLGDVDAAAEAFRRADAQPGF